MATTFPTVEIVQLHGIRGETHSIKSPPCKRNRTIYLIRLEIDAENNTTLFTFIQWSATESLNAIMNLVRADWGVIKLSPMAVASVAGLASRTRIANERER